MVVVVVVMVDELVNASVVVVVVVVGCLSVNVQNWSSCSQGYRSLHWGDVCRVKRY